MFKRLAMAALVATSCSAMLVSAATAEDRRVKIINETGMNLDKFFASNIGANSWEEDILGTDVLPAGDSFIIDIDDGSGYCKFDFKAVFEDGTELVKEGVNVCEIETFRYTQ